MIKSHFYERFIQKSLLETARTVYHITSRDEKFSKHSSVCHWSRQTLQFFWYPEFNLEPSFILCQREKKGKRMMSWVTDNSHDHASRIHFLSLTLRVLHWYEQDLRWFASRWLPDGYGNTTSVVTCIVYYCHETTNFHASEPGPRFVQI